MRIVITGGAGFLGRRLARKLLERGTLTDARGQPRTIASIVLLDVVPADLPADPRVAAVEFGDRLREVEIGGLHPHRHCPPRFRSEL